MGPILTTILSTVVVAALRKAIEEAMTPLLKSREPTVTEKEKLVVAEADRMVKVATLDEVKDYGPTWRAIEARVRPHPPRGSANRSAAKKAYVTKKAAPKDVGKTHGGVEEGVGKRVARSARANPVRCSTLTLMRATTPRR
ncbi:MAG: hypothetical protein SFV54_19245 [Bryobacteraceae bacterium]|nr:hypothetical protein [Bryobacteraceae bacterium]